MDYLKRFPLKIFFLIAFSFLLIVFYKDLGRENVNVDQFKWYARSENFFQAFSDGDYKNTYQQYHPGISLIYLVRAGQLTFNLFINNDLSFKEITYEYADTYNYFTKFYLVTFNLLLIASATFILFKIVKNIYIPAFFTFLILSEPYFVGNMRNLHMDALISLVILNSLMYFYYGFINKNRKYLFFAGIFLGLGLLTKSIIISVFLYIFAFCFVLFLLDKSNKFIKIYFAIVTIAFVTFSLLFPAMWTNPIETLSKVYYDGVFRVAIGGDESFTHIVNNVGVKDPGLTFYFLVLKYRLSLLHQLTIVLLFCGLVYLIFKKINFISFILKNDSLKFTVYLFGFFILFFIGLNLSEKKTDRYLIAVYPALIVASSVFYFYVWELIKTKYQRVILVSLICLLSVYNLVILYLIHPYYFAFYNPLYGGIQKARYEIYLNPGGTGAFEVAKYLNSKNLLADDLIGTTQRTEFAFFSKHPVIGLDYSKIKNYRYVLLTLQVGQNFRGKRDLKYGIEILGSPYLRLYGY